MTGSDTLGNDEVLATISASAPRRWLAVGCLFGLAFLFGYIAIVQPPAPGWQLLLIAMAGVSVWTGDVLRRATIHVIELTRSELRDSTGALIARVADIERVDRGMFAFKPSNGFLIRTKSAAGPRVWTPGLWWRIGRRIGVGGVTPGSQTKVAAEILQMMLAEREGG